MLFRRCSYFWKIVALQLSAVVLLAAAVSAQPPLEASVDDAAVTIKWRLAKRSLPAIAIRSTQLVPESAAGKRKEFKIKFSSSRRGSKKISIKEGSYKIALIGRTRGRTVVVAGPIVVEIDAPADNAGPGSTPTVPAIPESSPSATATPTPNPEVTPEPSATPTSTPTSTPTVSVGTAAIANWDIVPFQQFSGTLNVGVVAFHECFELAPWRALLGLMSGRALVWRR